MTSETFFSRCAFVLSHTSHPGNIGAAARAIKTMGFPRLALINPKQFPHAQASAMASGAEDVLASASVYTSINQALSGATFVVGVTARRRDLSHAVLDPRAAALVLLREERPALLFGNEMSGLSNSELDHCQLLVTIPANPAYSSLNLAAAVQIIAYELRVAAGGNGVAERPAAYAPHDEIERFYVHLEQVLVETGFLDPNQPKRLMQRLRRLFARTRLEVEEVNILRGILTAMKKVD